MAAKVLDSGSVIKQELDDITACCICTEVFTDPKGLPCIHTFCMKCLEENGLKTNKGPGDEMPCPICRRMFKIPPEGFPALPKNFFIERLIEASKSSEQSASSRVLCDACIDENTEETGKEIPAADAYCVECKHRLCEKCCSEHRKFKSTKSHKLITMTEHGIGSNVLPDLSPSVCELHQENVLNVYCADCKTVVCAICFIDDHNGHKGSHVKKFVDGFRKQIESNAEAINECRSQAETKKANLQKVQEDIQEKVKTLECDVETRKDELKQLTDRHAASLLQVLCSIRQSKRKEIQMVIDDIDTYLSCLETYNFYSQKIIAKGSASDICSAFSDLSVRAVELQQQCQPTTEGEFGSFNFRFRKSELEEFIEESCDNLIGEIEEEGELKPKRRSKESLLAVQTNEIDLLRKEIENERTEKESLRLSNEQLRISLNKEIQAFRAEIDKEKVNYDSRTEKLKKELDKNKTTISALQANNDKLKQELDASNRTNSSLQSTNNKLMQEVNSYKTTIKTLEDNVKKFTQEVNAYKATIKTLEDNVKKLRQELEMAKTDKLRYNLDPVLVHTIKTKAAEEAIKSTRGLTILDKELFVVSADSSEVEVYDSIKFGFSRRWKLKELIEPCDIASCNTNKCLYFLHYKNFGQSKEILRVAPNGNLIKSWLIGIDSACVYGYDCLSVAIDSNVILAFCGNNKLNEYSPDGHLVREINLSSNAGFHYPTHAIKLTNGHFVVSHGFSDTGLQRVCALDADGKLKKSFGGKFGSDIGQMNEPVHLSVDGNGFVMVADCDNHRVLLLDSDLEFKREIFSKEKHGLQYPSRILLDESNGRVFVVSSEVDSKILVFEVK